MFEAVQLKILGITLSKNSRNFKQTVLAKLDRSVPDGSSILIPLLPLPANLTYDNVLYHL
jgi:hypothetical protein